MKIKNKAKLKKKIKKMGLKWKEFKKLLKEVNWTCDNKKLKK